MSTSAQKPASVILFTAAQAFSILREVFLDWNALNVKYTRENARDPLIAYVKYAERNEESLSDWHWPIVSECRRILAYQKRGPQAVADIAHGGWINFETQLRHEAHRLIESELANELQNRLEDIESVAPPNPHGKQTTERQTYEMDSEAIPNKDPTLLTPAYLRLAYLAATFAEVEEGRQLTDNEAWTYLKENGIEKVEGFDGYQLPMQDTFNDYMNRARRFLGEKRKQPRGGRASRSAISRRKSD